MSMAGQVKGGNMDFTTHAATEREGKADMTEGILYGDDEDRVKMSVSEDSST